jgi:hypothetical protein
MENNKSILDQNISPLKQVIGSLVLALVLMLASKIMPISPYSKTGHIMPWIALCGAILFFAIMNSILSLGASSHKYYWMHSVISFAGLLIVGGFFAWLISGIGIYDAGSVSWIYIVFTLGYLVFLSIVNLIKFFVYLAQRQDKRFDENN